jgi:16S rRNA (adenine(1408)-N(1))-methyltransferase
VEELPDELSGIADEVHIQFPWGSLLRTVARGDEHALKSLRRLCRKEAQLEILVGLDPVREASELERLGIPELSPAYLEQQLVPAYAANGFAIESFGVIPASQWPKIESSWAKKLRRSPTRVLVYLRAVAQRL